VIEIVYFGAKACLYIEETIITVCAKWEQLVFGMTRAIKMNSTAPWAYEECIHCTWCIVTIVPVMIGV
jgi:hypothetical protein